MRGGCKHMVECVCCVMWCRAQRVCCCGQSMLQQACCMASAVNTRKHTKEQAALLFPSDAVAASQQSYATPCNLCEGAHPKQPAMMPQMTQMEASQRGPPMRVISMLAGIWQHAYPVCRGSRGQRLGVMQSPPAVHR